MRLYATISFHTPVILPSDITVLILKASLYDPLKNIYIYIDAYTMLMLQPSLNVKNNPQRSETTTQINTGTLFRLHGA
jgi:hypothetical protein